MAHLPHHWTIKGFCNDRRKLFDEDYQSQQAAVRADFRTVLNGLRDQVAIEGWSRPNGFDRLKGKYRELGKLRFKVKNVQHRPLGFFGPGAREFTLLIWATERDGKFDPPNVRDTALERMKQTIADPTRAQEFDPLKENS